ncbi:hypothetical protein [Rhodococcus sp. SORGH_AS_0303]|uniref:hypothetical protein n=1 Tax=Rhodococcus sp. SORGH_AS_0303 TaxID=3041753 RepID=UPI0027826142|nr:hypothetical protein [Rhodococcus sp. SORGH_AS_0303]MDQ1201522.1 hypothetical protein [Rhodococcus sp. SORGH_AS_0303]
MRKFRAALLACTVIVLSSCGAENSAPTEPSVAPSTTISTQTTTTAAAPPPAGAQTVTETVDVEPIYTEPVQAEPVIVDCQMGLGPVVTYWSDGTVTGYSDYCQSVHDQVLQSEIAANTPTCDGSVCTYPNGASYPDPNAAPDDRCTNQIDYAGDPRSNAEINSLGETNGVCPAPIA